MEGVSEGCEGGHEGVNVPQLKSIGANLAVKASLSSQDLQMLRIRLKENEPWIYRFTAVLSQLGLNLRRKYFIVYKLSLIHI